MAQSRIAVAVAVVLCLACVQQPKPIAERSGTWIELTAFPPVMVRPGDVTLVARVYGPMPDCPTIMWAYGDGCYSVHSELCEPGEKPDRVYTVHHHLHSADMARPAFALYDSDGRTIALVSIPLIAITPQ